MANVQITGFKPKCRGGETVMVKRRRVLTNNTTAIFKFDAVERGADGAWVVAAAANDQISSVSLGASYVSSGQRVERQYLPAATLYTSSGVNPWNASFIYAVDNVVDTVFNATVDEAITMAELGLNFKMVLGTGSTTTGLSGHELDATTPASTATFPFRVDDFERDDISNDLDAADCIVVCRVNQSLEEPGGDPDGL